VRQWESRCADLRDLVTGHEARCKEAAAEVMKGNDIIEKLQVRHLNHHIGTSTAGSNIGRTVCIPVSGESCPATPLCFLPCAITNDCPCLCVLLHLCYLLQNEVRVEREKGKRKKAILLRQEQELANKESQLAAAQRELNSLGHSKVSQLALALGAADGQMSQ